MARYVHLHVAFACDNPSPLAALAAEHHACLPETSPDGGCQEARWFLAHLMQEPPLFEGPKGSLCLWGCVGNHTDGAAFVEVLRPFWHGLLTRDLDGFPLLFEHILVFEEQEQSRQAVAYEIGLARDGEGPLTITRHACPFAWNQY